MGKFCLYSDTVKDAPCITVKTFKYSYLDTFLNDEKKEAQDYSIPIIIDCLELKDNNKPSIIDYKCINCMFCIFGCYGNKIIISSNMQPKEFCADISSNQKAELHNSFISKLFNGSFIKLPPVPFSKIKAKYKNFEAFTSINETKNIAVWGVNAMKYLTRSLEPRISLEVGLEIQERDRGGRLDISLYNAKDNFLFLVETKISFEALMQENRYESQLLAYETEIEKNCSSNIKRCKILMIGGNESDLLPSKHPDCTSLTGNKSDEFYSVLRKNNFFFISANAMLALGLMKLFVSYENYNLENIFPFINDPQYIGLLSSGIVKFNGEILPLNVVI